MTIIGSANYAIYGGYDMSKANISLLKEAAKELRDIKNGKGITKQLDKMDAFKALHHINILIDKFESAELDDCEVSE